MDQEQSQFEGWAVVEQMGHNKYAGYVTTQAFGQASLFRIEVPPLPEREYTLTRPSYDGGEYAPAGSVVKRGSSPGYCKLIGPSSIFAITPCSEELVRETLESITPRPLTILSRPAKAALPEPEDDEEEEEDEQDDPDFYDQEEAEAV